MLRAKLTIAGSNFIFSHINENYSEYLSKENPVYDYIRKKIGIFTSVGFLSLILIFMSFQTTFLDSGRIYEYDDLFPDWVIREQGLQDLNYVPLYDLSSYLDFLIGIAALAGLAYIILHYKKKS